MRKRLKAVDSEEAKLISGERKKWQIALRRYVLENNPSPYYAPFFGVDIETFRKWIEAQFVHGLSWENFGSDWQFEQVVSSLYFSFEDEDELRLCWNFTNIIVASDLIGEKPDLLTAKAFFKNLFQKTNYPPCGGIVKKIESIEDHLVSKSGRYSHFLEETNLELQAFYKLREADLARINKGETLKNILLEKEILSKFGA